MPKLLRYLTVSFCLSTCNIDQCLWSEYDRACHSNIDHVPYHCNALQVQAVGRTGEEEESRGRGVNFGFRCWCFDHIVWAVFPFRETRLPVWIIYILAMLQTTLIELRSQVTVHDKYLLCPRKWSNRRRCRAHTARGSSPCFTENMPAQPVASLIVHPALNIRSVIS